MPDLGGQRKLDLSGAGSRRRGAATGGQKKSGSPAPPPEKPKKAMASQIKRTSNGKGRESDEDEEEEEEDYDEEDDDEIITSSLQNGGKGTPNVIFIGVAVIVVILVVVLFVVFRGRVGKDPAPISPDPGTTQTDSSNSSEAPPPDVGEDPNVGTQDFTQNTNNTADTELTDPEGFTKDLYGLTTRVDYTVSKIQSAADFVSYTKKRGTWGGGLELYYLEAEYKGYKYVVQVPFQYYKELDEVGIVPVKMEVLRIKPDTGEDYLTVVSYMCLDEETLKSILKSQTK